MDSLRAKRRRLDGPSRAPIASAFAPGSSSQHPARTTTPNIPNTARRHGDPAHYGRRQADSVEADAQDGRADQAGVELPEQLPALPSDDDDQENQDEEQERPKQQRPPSRAQHLKDILHFQKVVERYGDGGEARTQTSGRDTGQPNVRLAQAIHAYAIEFYHSRDLLPFDRLGNRNEKDGKSRARGNLNRGEDVIPPHLCRRSPSPPQTGGEVVSNAEDSDYIVSEAEDEEEIATRRTRRPARRPNTRSSAAALQTASVQDAFDDTALFAVSTFVEETVIALLGDHGLELSQR